MQQASLIMHSEVRFLKDSVFVRANDVKRYNLRKKKKREEDVRKSFHAKIFYSLRSLLPERRCEFIRTLFNIH